MNRLALFTSFIIMLFSPLCYAAEGQFRIFDFNISVEKYLIDADNQMHFNPTVYFKVNPSDCTKKM